MKTFLIILCTSLFIVSCEKTKKDKKNHISKTENGNDIPQEFILRKIDTIIEYNIEDISSEGTSAFAKYKSGIIKSVDISVYSERGQFKEQYDFCDDNISVLEKKYGYGEKLITEIKSDDDMILLTEIKYEMDIEGNPVNGNKLPNERLDILNELKEVVPFKLLLNNLD